MSFAHLSDEKLVEILGHGIDDARDFQNQFRAAGNDEAVTFCNRMIIRLHESAERLKSKQ